MNAIVTPAAQTPVAPYKVDPFAGRHVSELSRQWTARPHDQRFLNLTDLRNSVRARADRSREDVVDTRTIEIIAPTPKSTDDLSKLFVGLPDGKQVAPTHWSFGQLASLAGAPTGYLRRLPSPIVADALSYGLRYGRASDEIKLYGTRAELLAATGPEYGRIYDEEVVDAVAQVAGNGTGDTRWKIPGMLDWRTMTYDPEYPVTRDTTTLYASDRDVWIFLVDDRNPIEVGKLPDGSPDLMFRGFYVANSEVGSSALKVAGFYLRARCCNALLWGVENFNEVTMRHTKYAPSRFIEEIRPALVSYSEGSSEKLRDGVEKAKAAKVAADGDAAIDFLIERGFSRKNSLAILDQHEKEEGHPARTAWDFAQGITAFARSIDHADERVEVATVARKILDKVL